mmetsp:Transcript_7616/g.17064  ORF Transcript_7616/g.17064 Transcript_7616/m.17064 type:complete len:249 (-) Transcript_7616:1587-2333(-)
MPPTPTQSQLLSRQRRQQWRRRRQQRRQQQHPQHLHHPQQQQQQQLQQARAILLGCQLPLPRCMQLLQQFLLQQLLTEEHMLVSALPLQPFPQRQRQPWRRRPLGLALGRVLHRVHLRTSTTSQPRPLKRSLRRRGCNPQSPGPSSHHRDRSPQQQHQQQRRWEQHPPPRPRSLRQSTQQWLRSFPNSRPLDTNPLGKARPEHPPPPHLPRPRGSDFLPQYPHNKELPQQHILLKPPHHKEAFRQQHH